MDTQKIVIAVLHLDWQELLVHSSLLALGKPASVGWGIYRKPFCLDEI